MIDFVLKNKMLFYLTYGDRAYGRLFRKFNLSNDTCDAIAAGTYFPPMDQAERIIRFINDDQYNI